MPRKRQQTREEWLEERRTGLGGSDMPVILGLSSFKDPRTLWAEKLGLLPEPELDASMKRGMVLEPIVANIYAEVTGRRVQRCNRILRHPKRNYVLANIDRWVWNEAGEKGPLEVKCPGVAAFSKCEQQGLLPYYYPQLQNYMAVTGKQWGSLAMFSAERWSLLHFDMQRDDEFIEYMYETADKFWECVVLEVEPPDPVDYTYPEFTGTIIYKGEEAWQSPSEELREAMMLKAQAEERYTAAVAAYQALMGDEQAVASFGVKVYWKWQQGRETIDKIALAKKYPGLDLDDFKRRGAPFRVFKPYTIEIKEDENA